MSEQNKVLTNIPQSLSEEAKAQARTNIGAASMSAVAPEFSEDDTYYIGENAWYRGNLYTFYIRHNPGPWDSSEVVDCKHIGGLVNGGILTDGDTVNVPRNGCIGRLSTSRDSVTFEIILTRDSSIPVFYALVINSNPCRVYIKIRYDMGPGNPQVIAYVAYSADVGQVLDACGPGEGSMLSCVGGSWTWRKVLDGTPPQQNVSAVQTQGVQSVGLSDFVVGGSLAEG